MGKAKRKKKYAYAVFFIARSGIDLINGQSVIEIDIKLKEATFVDFILKVKKIISKEYGIVEDEIVLTGCVRISKK